jgi:RND superfamily putative drug exporter
LVAWVVVLAGVSVLGSTVDGTFLDEFGGGSTESERASELLEDRGFGERAGFGGQVVFASEQGVDDLAVRATMETFFAEVETSVDDASVRSPYAEGGANQVSEDGTIAFAEVDLTDRTSAEYREVTGQVNDLAEQVELEGLQVELGGDVFYEPEEGGGEVIGLLAAVVILLVAFGSVLAAGLPILTALVGVGTGVGVVALVANLVTMPTFTNQVVVMLGIGVGIDYALFIVTRYREALAEGREPEAAVVVAMDTAGRSVLFAGTTVVISVLGLLLMGLPAMTGLGIGAATGVLFTMLASVTLLPAVLGFVGRTIDRLGLRRGDRSEPRPDVWQRWSQVVQRHPWTAALLGAAVLLVLAAPVLVMRLGFADASNRPDGETTRDAFDLVAEGFGAGANGPLILAVDLPEGADAALADEVAAEVEQTDGVALVVAPTPNEAGDAAIIQVFPETAPQDEATSQLVHRIRAEAVPAAVEDTDAVVLVGGFTAESVDFSDYMGARLPLVLAAVLLLSFLLLMAVFRSLLVPLKAVIMNLLSIGAAYGVVVAVFQWGWGQDLLGLGDPGPIEAWAPMMLFAVVFGLSMDYEVFLLSRIKEEYDRTGDNTTAVADGLASTARVITAAAAIMVVVFGGFIFGTERALTLLGLGLSTAVFIDATVVRLVLVPATMELLGDRNWWLPGWLDRIVPTITVEPSTIDADLPPFEPGVSGDPEPAPA